MNRRSDARLSAFWYSCSHSSCLVRVVVSSFFPTTRIKYEEWLQLYQKADNLVSLHRFSLCQIAILTKTKATDELVQPQEKTLTTRIIHAEIPHIGFESAPLIKTKPHRSQSGNCVLFEGPPHPLFRCETFKKVDVDSRWTVVRQQSLCFGCFQSQHRVFDCPKRQCCGILNCSASHNRMLHKDSTKTSKVNMVKKSTEIERQQTATGQSSQAAHVCTKHGRLFQGCIALRTVPVVVSCDGDRITVIAVLDDCITGCHIVEDTANAVA